MDYVEDYLNGQNEYIKVDKAVGQYVVGYRSISLQNLTGYEKNRNGDDYLLMTGYLYPVLSA